MTVMGQTFRCKGPCKEDKLASEFPYHKQPGTGTLYRISKCKVCINRERWSLRTISLLKVRPYLEEIIFYTGSKRAAAKELNITHTQLRHWLGISAKYKSDGSKYYQKRVGKAGVANIINTLRRLRNEQRKAA